MSVDLNTNAICALVNADAFKKFSLSWIRDHRWRIPTPICRVFGELVKTFEVV